MSSILVIDDNIESLELMHFLLQSFGYDVQVASSGEEGLSIAAVKRPNLIICDIHMPVLDGFGVIARLRADPTLRSIPCIAVTALAMVGDETKILSAGFDGYISKPIDPEKFVKEIKNYLEK